MRRLTFSIGLMFFISACSLYQMDYESLTFDYHPSRASKDEIAYMEKVDRPYEVIGRATVNVERTKKLEDVLDKLKHEAAILGGEAITNITTNAGTGKWAKIKPKKLFGNANIRTNFVADVIVFK